MHIGGTDNPVATHPHTREPYIPGSSLKGKIRSLLEMRSGLMTVTGGKPLGADILRKKSVEGASRDEAMKILRIFGVSGADSDETSEIGPTRASFADCPLTANSRDLARANNWPLTEVKSENSIDRIKGVAQNPRFTERVPAGMEFDFMVALKKMATDSEDLLDFLLEGMKLVEYDALGGSGSRGYGRVRFVFDQPEIQQRYESLNPLP
jgi:CRISPR-associated protein Csm3